MGHITIQTVAVVWHATCRRVVHDTICSASSGGVPDDTIFLICPVATAAAAAVAATRSLTGIRVVVHGLFSQVGPPGEIGDPRGGSMRGRCILLILLLRRGRGLLARSRPLLWDLLVLLDGGLPLMLQPLLLLLKKGHLLLVLLLPLVGLHAVEFGRRGAAVA